VTLKRRIGKLELSRPKPTQAPPVPPELKRAILRLTYAERRALRACLLEALEKGEEHELIVAAARERLGAKLAGDDAQGIGTLKSIVAEAGQSPSSQRAKDAAVLLLEAYKGQEKAAPREP
jgi:hypothetical protein